MKDPREPDGFDEYMSKIAFTIPWVKIPVNLFVVHGVLVVATIVLVERLVAHGVIG